MRKFWLAMAMTLFPGAALAWCVENASAVEIQVRQTRGHVHGHAFASRMPPGSVFCAPYDANAYNGGSRRNAVLAFEANYDGDKLREQMEHKAITNLAKLGKFTALRAPVPVSPILGSMHKVCNGSIKATDTLSFVAAPGKASPWDKLTGLTPMPRWTCRTRAGDAFPDETEREPANTAECRQQYHACAQQARTCRGGDCPSVDDCLAQDRACDARVRGIAPGIEAGADARWAAVAVNQVAQSVFSGGHPDRAAAVSAALADCRRQNAANAASCELEQAFQLCAAGAMPHHDTGSYYSGGYTLGEAEAEAMRYCRAETRDSCELTWSYCADGRGGIKAIDHGYGSIAKPRQGSGQAVIETRGWYADDADMKAREACKRMHGVDCETVVNFATCAAYADSESGAGGWGRSETLAQARSEALRQCDRHQRGHCRAVVAGCVGPPQR